MGELTRGIYQPGYSQIRLFPEKANNALTKLKYISTRSYICGDEIGAIRSCHARPSVLKLDQELISSSFIFSSLYIYSQTIDTLAHRFIYIFVHCILLVFLIVLPSFWYTFLCFLIILEHKIIQIMQGVQKRNISLGAGTKVYCRKYCSREEGLWSDVVADEVLPG